MTQFEADHGDPLFEEMLNRIDQNVAVQKAVGYITSSLPARDIYWEKEWEKVHTFENQVKAYLAAMDPIITAGLHSMSTRTWGIDGFSFTKHGPGVTTDTLVCGVTIAGSTPITDIDLSGLQTPGHLPFKKLNSFDFSYSATQRDAVGYYDSYRVGIYFEHRKPYRLTIGSQIPLLSPYDLTQRTLSPDELRDILARYYIMGPTYYRNSSGEG